MRECTLVASSIYSRCAHSETSGSVDLSVQTWAKPYQGFLVCCGVSLWNWRDLHLTHDPLYLKVKSPRQEQFGTQPNHQGAILINFLPGALSLIKNKAKHQISIQLSTIFIEKLLYTTFGRGCQLCWSLTGTRRKSPKKPIPCGVLRQQRVRDATLLSQYLKLPNYMEAHTAMCVISLSVSQEK